MLKGMILPIAFALVASASVQADAAACRDAKSKFVKCAPKPAVVHCKDARGKFVKCSAPGAKPVAKIAVVKSKSNITNN